MRLRAASLLLGMLAVAPSVYGAACASSFTPGTFCQSLTIDHTKVGASDSTNFPVLVDLSAFAGHVLNASGFDIQFWSDAAATSALTWEIDFWDNTGKVLWAWVKIPTVSHTTDTTFYMTYNNPTISTFQSTPANVWTNGYTGVWHMSADSSAVRLTDSTSNANNGTNHSSTAGAGQIAGGGVFVAASSQWVGLADCTAGGPLCPNAVSLSAWMKITNSAVVKMVFRKGGSGYFMRAGTANTAQFFAFDSGGNQIGGTSGQAVNDGNWHYCAGTFDATASITNALSIYCDAAAVVQANAVATGNIKYTPSSTNIGSDITPPTTTFGGSLDEIHVASVVRSADWVTAEFNNQSSPGTFSTATSEQRTRTWGLAMMGMQ